MLFLSNLHHLQQDSGKQVVGLDLGMGLEQYLNSLHIFTSPLIIAGLIFLLLSIFASGKESLLVRRICACIFICFGIKVYLLICRDTDQIICFRNYFQLFTYEISVHKKYRLHTIEIHGQNHFEDFAVCSNFDHETDVTFLVDVCRKSKNYLICKFWVHTKKSLII